MLLLDIATKLSFWGPVILFPIGVVSAFFNITIFTGVKTFRQSPSTYYIVGKSIADVGVLLLLVLQSVSSVSMSTSSVACKSSIYVSQVLGPTAMCLLCLSAFDRWACTSRSARIRKLSSTRVARGLCVFAYVFWSSVSIPYLLYCDLVPPTYSCAFTDLLFAQISLYFLAPIVTCILPVIVLMIFGMLTYRNIRIVTRAHQEAARARLSTWEQQMTRMMIAQTLLSILCTFPRAILFIYIIATFNTYAMRGLDQILVELVIDKVTLIIAGINFASSFYIYFVSSPRVRQTMKMCLLCQFSLKNNQVGPMTISHTAHATGMQTIEKKN